MRKREGKSGWLALLAALACVFVPHEYGHLTGGLFGLSFGGWLAFGALSNQARGIAKPHARLTLQGQSARVYNAMIVCLGVVVSCFGLAAFIGL